LNVTAMKFGTRAACLPCATAIFGTNTTARSAAAVIAWRWILITGLASKQMI
jgi:hypothetical protein